VTPRTRHQYSPFATTSGSDARVLRVEMLAMSELKPGSAENSNS